ncbi:MAG: hypothetical protein GY816_17910 [Cytophagales bacterium]|nr:hypothetical protein [Cytophagales bacterium]
MRRLLIIVCLLSTLQLIGQNSDVYEKYNIYRNPVKLILNKFAWTLATGYGKTYYKHDLSGYYFYQDRIGQYILPSDAVIGTQFQGFSNWFNDPSLGPEVPVRDPFDVPFPSLSNPVLNPELQNAQFFANGDTTEIGFRGISHGIPVTLQFHYNFLEKFRMGIGYSWEKQYIGELLPTSYQGVIRSYQPNIESTIYSRLFGTVGYQFYTYYEHLFVAELQVGRIKSGPEFNAAIQRSLYINFGVSMEKQLSEYFRVIVKPSIDFKNFNVSIPGGSEITHQHPTLFLQVGVSINIPEIPRSPISNDHIQLKHVITDPSTGRLIEVRGQPITKWQNPKVGQNHRKLFRYKNRNKKKLNPY